MPGERSWSARGEVEGGGVCGPGGGVIGWRGGVWQAGRDSGSLSGDTVGSNGSYLHIRLETEVVTKRLFNIFIFSKINLLEIKAH